MAFTFTMFYKPEYQKRYGKCNVCRQGIELGERIMVGTGYYHGQYVQNHNHYGCWFEAVEKRAKEWFFTNEYTRKKRTTEQIMALNRLRTRRYYIQKKGGEQNVVDKKVAEVEEQIAFVKAGKLVPNNIKEN